MFPINLKLLQYYGVKNANTCPLNANLTVKLVMIPP